MTWLRCVRLPTVAATRGMRREVTEGLGGLTALASAMCHRPSAIATHNRVMMMTTTTKPTSFASDASMLARTEAEEAVVPNVTLIEQDPEVNDVLPGAAISQSDLVMEAKEEATPSIEENLPLDATENASEAPITNLVADVKNYRVRNRYRTFIDSMRPLPNRLAPVQIVGRYSFQFAYDVNYNENHLRVFQVKKIFRQDVPYSLSRAVRSHLHAFVNDALDKNDTIDGNMLTDMLTILENDDGFYFAVKAISKAREIGMTITSEQYNSAVRCFLFRLHPKKIYKIATLQSKSMLINALADSQNFQLLAHMMIDDGHYFDIDTYVTMLVALRSLGAPPLMRQVLRSMSRYGIRPNISCYNLYLDVLSRGGENNMFREFFLDMQVNGCVDWVSFQLAILTTLRMGKIDVAQNLFETMVDAMRNPADTYATSNEDNSFSIEPVALPFLSMVEAYTRQNDTNGINNVLQLLLSKQPKILPILGSDLPRYLLRNEMIDIATSFFKDATEAEPSISMAYYRSYLAFFIQEDHDRFRAFYQEFMSSDGILDGRIFAEAIRIVSRMRRIGAPSSQIDRFMSILMEPFQVPEKAHYLTAFEETNEIEPTLKTETVVESTSEATAGNESHMVPNTCTASQCVLRILPDIDLAVHLSTEVRLLLSILYRQCQKTDTINQNFMSKDVVDAMILHIESSGDWQTAFTCMKHVVNTRYMLLRSHKRFVELEGSRQLGRIPKLFSRRGIVALLRTAYRRNDMDAMLYIYRLLLRNPWHWIPSDLKEYCERHFSQALPFGTENTMTGSSKEPRNLSRGPNNSTDRNAFQRRRRIDGWMRDPEHSMKPPTSSLCAEHVALVETAKRNK